MTESEIKEWLEDHLPFFADKLRTGHWSFTFESLAKMVQEIIQINNANLE